MADKKLNELLGAVQKLPLKKLEAFINSPYHNTNANIVKLLRHLKTKSGSNENNLNDNLESGGISKAIFGGDKNAHRKTVLLLTDFKNILNSFILNEYIQNNPDEKLFTLLKVYRPNGMRKNYSGLKDKYARSAAPEAGQTWNRYYRDVTLERDDKLSRIIEIIYSSSDELKELSGSIDLLFICSKLEVYTAMSLHKNETLFSLGYNFKFKQILLDYIRENEPYIKKDHPLIYSYYLILMMLDEKQGDHYFNTLKKYLLSNRSKFSPGIFKVLIMVYKNSCDSRIHLDPQKYEREVFFVYDLLDKNNTYQAEGGIEPNDFMNAVISALAMNKVKRAYYFFNKYKNKIISSGDDTFRSDTVHMVKARLDFHTKNYTQALNELNKINSKQFYFYLRIRILRIKIYYDLNEIDALGYIIDAMTHYIKRNKNLIGTNYELIYNFLAYLNKIIRIKLGKKIDDKAGLLQKITLQQNIASRDWLIEKINALN
jgi:hypothetical protein